MPKPTTSYTVTVFTLFMRVRSPPGRHPAARLLFPIRADVGVKRLPCTRRNEWVVPLHYSIVPKGPPSLRRNFRQNEVVASNRTEGKDSVGSVTLSPLRRRIEGVGGWRLIRRPRTKGQTSGKQKSGEWRREDIFQRGERQGQKTKICNGCMLSSTTRAR